MQAKTNNLNPDSVLTDPRQTLRSIIAAWDDHKIFVGLASNLTQIENCFLSTVSFNSQSQIGPVFSNVNRSLGVVISICYLRYLD